MYKLVAADTDAIKICREDGLSMTEDEMDDLLNRMNAATPKLINLEKDGYYKRFLVLKSKNYVTDDGKKIKYRGSSILDQKKEPALKEFLFKIINGIMDELNFNQLQNIYKTYLNESQNITDINRWAVKKTITKAVLEGDRKNETKVKDALEGQILQEGDKVWLYNAIDGEIQAIVKREPKFYKKTGLPKMIPNKVLKTLDKWSQDENKEHYAMRIVDTLDILANVLDVKKIKDLT